LGEPGSGEAVLGVPAVASGLTTVQQDYLLQARQMQALSFVVHIPLVCFGIAFPAMILFIEWRYLRTGDEVYKTLARRWTRVLVTLFAAGVVTGTILSFEMGLLWPNLTSATSESRHRRRPTWRRSSIPTTTTRTTRTTSRTQTARRRVMTRPPATTPISPPRRAEPEYTRSRRSSRRYSELLIDLIGPVGLDWLIDAPRLRGRSGSRLGDHLTVP
jgi:hypothetical protein